MLRPLTEHDLPTRARWTMDRELAELMGLQAPMPNTPVSLQKETDSNCRWLKQRHRNGSFPYAVEVKGNYIGDIDYGIYLDKGMADLTVFLGDRESWGKGYGTQAVELILGEFFTLNPIEFVEVDVAPQNERALRFWNKLGFEYFRSASRGTRFLRRYRGGLPAKIALASSKVTPDATQNIREIRTKIMEAGQNGCDLICFPEAALGFEVDDYKQGYYTAIEIPGPVTEDISSLAAEAGIFVALGILEREGKRIYDSSILVDDSGSIVLKYRRINPQWRDPCVFPDQYGEGTEFVTACTPLGQVGIAICGDTGDSRVVAKIKAAGVDFLINPRNANFNDFSYDQSRWDREKGWATEQAAEMGTTVIMVNAYADVDHGAAYGGSMVVSACGDILFESPIGSPRMVTYSGVPVRKQGQ